MKKQQSKPQEQTEAGAGSTMEQGAESVEQGMGSEQETEGQREARELRDAARFIEMESLDALEDYAEIPRPLVIGNLQFFPRPAPEDRAAEEGFDVLRAQALQAVAVLRALAAVRESGRAVPPALQMMAQPFLLAYRAARGASTGAAGGSGAAP
jgi:hypothetical protein